jgi:hypothetical protein
MEELDRYRWCGHSVLVGKQKNSWQEKEYILGMFGGEKRRAIWAYRKFVEEGKDQGRRPELVGGGLIRSLGGWSRVISMRGKREEAANDARILGGGDFVEGIIREADKKLSRQVKFGRKKGSIDQIIKKMCKEEGVKEGELRSGGKRREVTRVRRKIAYYLSKEAGISMAEIARHLGVGTSAIGMAIGKIEAREK